MNTSIEKHVFTTADWSSMQFSSSAMNRPSELDESDHFVGCCMKPYNGNVDGSLRGPGKLTVGRLRVCLSVCPEDNFLTT